MAAVCAAGRGVRSSCIVLLILTLCYWPLCRCDLTPDDLEQIDNFIDEVLTCNNIPGMTLSVVHRGEAVITKGYGIANLETNETVSEDTQFVIASVTKSMTAALLAKILDETDGVDWDTPVRALLGEDFYFYDSYTSNVSSIRDLLAHKMAVPRHDMVWHFDQWSTEELVERIRFFEPDAPYRTGDFYNNLMYGVAGHVTERLGGGHWKDLIAQHLFDPIGMETSHVIDPSVTDHSGYAISYTDRKGVRFPVPFELFSAGRSVAAMGMVVSNAVDMAKWLAFMLAEGKTEDGTQLIPSEALRELHVPEMALNRENIAQRPHDPYTLSGHEKYAKGWRNGYYRGYAMMTHGGYFPEYSSQQSIYPDLDLGIFTSYNGPKSFDNLLQHAYIVDLATDEQPWLEPADLCTSEALQARHTWYREDDYSDAGHQDSCQTIAEPSLDANISAHNRSLEDYVGVYGNFGYGNATVEIEGDQLYFYYGNLGYFLLLPSNDTADRFKAIGSNVVSVIRDIGFIQFLSSDDTAIDLLFVGRPEEPLFVRDLRYEDAPPPPAQC